MTLSYAEPMLQEFGQSLYYAESVESVGPVRFIVSPNKIHHLFLSEWARRWPEARLYAPPGLAKRKPGLSYTYE